MNTLFAVTLCLAFLSLYPIWLFLAEFWIPLLLPLCCSVFEVTFFSFVVFLSSLFVPMSCLSHWDSTQSTVLSAELPAVLWWVKKSFISWALWWWTNATARNWETIPAISVSVLSPKFRYYIFIYIFNKYFIMESIILVECIRISCSQCLLTLCRVCYSLKYPQIVQRV